MDRIHDILNSVNETLANAAKTQKSKEPEKKLKAEMEMDDYQESFYEMSVGSLKAIAAHAQDIINNLVYILIGKEKLIDENKFN